MKVKIGPYNGEDFGQLEEIFLNSAIYEAYFKKNGMNKIFRNAVNAGQLYVAKAPDGTPAGVLWIVPRGFCGLYPYLELIGVHEKYRGEGVGGQMLEFLEAFGREGGARKISLMVSGINPSGQNFYLKHGYYVLGEIPDATGRGISEIVMLKDL